MSKTIRGGWCDYYTGKTIIDDGKAVMNIADSVNPKIVTAWLEE